MLVSMFTLVAVGFTDCCVCLTYDSTLRHAFTVQIEIIRKHFFFVCSCCYKSVGYCHSLYICWAW